MSKLPSSSDKAGSASVRRHDVIFGFLGYLSQGTIPDISAVVNILIRFVVGTTREHMEAAKMALLYLNWTNDE